MNIPKLPASVDGAKLFLGVVLSQPLVILSILEAAILVGFLGKSVGFGLYFFFGWNFFFWVGLISLINGFLVTAYYLYLRRKYRREGFLDEL